MAKFTSSNGSVFGSLILDIRKAGDYSQPLPVAVRIAYEGKKAFLRLGEKYTMEEWIQLCDYEKTGRRVQMAERNNLKALMEKIMATPRTCLRILATTRRQAVNTNSLMWQP